VVFTSQKEIILIESNLTTLYLAKTVAAKIRPWPLKWFCFVFNFQYLIVCDHLYLQTKNAHSVGKNYVGPSKRNFHKKMY